MRNLRQYPITLQEKLHEIDEAYERAVAGMGDRVGDIGPTVWQEIRADVIRQNTSMQTTSPESVKLEE